MIGRGKLKNTKKESDYIGCGDPPFTIKDTDFFKACEWHDRAYTDGSWHQQNLSRDEVDKWFLAQMLAIAGDSKIQRIRAYAYFWLVRLFGRKWWEGKR